MKYLSVLLLSVTILTGCGGEAAPEPQRSPLLDVTFDDFVGRWASPKVTENYQFLSIAGQNKVIYKRQNTRADTLNATFEKFEFSKNTHPNVQFFYNNFKFQLNYIIGPQNQVHLESEGIDYYKQ